jgi:hypothetical protein
MAWDKLEIQHSAKERDTDEAVKQEDTIAKTEEDITVTDERKEAEDGEVPVKKKSRRRNRGRRKKHTEVKPENAAVESIISEAPHTNIEVKQESSEAENIPAITSAVETEPPVIQNPQTGSVKMLITPVESKPLPIQETNDPLVAVGEAEKKEDNI